MALDLNRQLEQAKKNWLAAQQRGDQAAMDAAHAEANRLRAMGASELAANQAVYGTDRGTLMTNLYSANYGAAPQQMQTQQQPQPTMQSQQRVASTQSASLTSAAPARTIDWNAWVTGGIAPQGTVVDPAYGLAVAKQRYEAAQRAGDAAGMAQAAQAGQYFRSLNPNLDPGNTMTAAQFAQTYTSMANAGGLQAQAYEQFTPPTFSTETQWDQQIADYIRRIEQAVAQGDVTAAEIMKTPEFKALQESQKALLEGTTRQTKARLAASGMLGPGSSVAASQIARVQAEAAAALAAKIPELIDRERRNRLQNLQNLQAQLQNLQSMRQDELRQRQIDFEQQMRQREFGLREGEALGRYMPAELRNLYDQVLQAKENWDRYAKEGRMDLANQEAAKAESLRRRIAALGGDPDAVGPGVTLEQAARNVGQLASQTLGGRQSDLQTMQTLASIENQRRQTEIDAAREARLSAQQLIDERNLTLSERQAQELNAIAQDIWDRFERGESLDRVERFIMGNASNLPPQVTVTDVLYLMGDIYNKWWRTKYEDRNKAESDPVAGILGGR